MSYEATLSGFLTQKNVPHAELGHRGVKVLPARGRLAPPLQFPDGAEHAPD